MARADTDAGVGLVGDHPSDDDRVDADVVGGEFYRHRLVQAFDGVLRRAIDRARRRADMAHLRRHVNDRPAIALCDHFAGNDLGDEKRGFDVQVHDLIEIGFRHLDKGLGRVGAGVVDQDIDTFQPADFGLDLAQVADIAVQAQCNV